MTATLGGISAEGIGFILFLIAFIQWRKSNGAKAVCWLVLVASMLMSGPILSWLGLLTRVTVFGVGLVLAGLIVFGLLFYHEVLKGRGLDYIRSPLVSIGLGLCLMSVGGTITGLAQQATGGIVQVVHQSSTIGGGG
jgi:hypothetical protein